MLAFILIIKNIILELNIIFLPAMLTETHRRTGAEKCPPRQNEFARLRALPDQSNSPLNFGNFRKAKHLSPHCPIFLHFLLLSYIFFSVYFPHFFPTYVQQLPDLRSQFAQLINISIFRGGAAPHLVRLCRNTPFINKYSK